MDPHVDKVDGLNSKVPTDHRAVTSRQPHSPTNTEGTLITGCGQQTDRRKTPINHT